MDKFNNYENVQDYASKQKNHLFYFWEEISLFDEEEEYPQGLCFAEDYISISSYSGNRGHLGKIKIFDKDTGEYLITLGLDENSHLGGLAFDGKNLWVCNSSKMSLERISFAFIKHVIQEYKGESIDVRNLVERYRVKNIPSCVTYYDGYLWVATHSIWTNAVLMSYEYEENRNKINTIDLFWVPSKVQGIAFNEEGEIYLSTSYGRRSSSFLIKYNSVYTMSQDVDDLEEEIELPPCSEGIAYEENKIYIVFESAGKKYRDGTDGKGKSIAPLNRILVIENKKDALDK